MHWIQPSSPKQIKHSRKQKERIMLWLGKFAFPEICTHKTKIVYVPNGTYECKFAVLEPISVDINLKTPTTVDIKTDTVRLRKWGYTGKRRRCSLVFAYYDKQDVLVVRETSFACEQAPFSTASL